MDLARSSSRREADRTSDKDKLVSMVYAKNNVIAVTAYGGDAKTLLAFDLTADNNGLALSGSSAGSSSSASSGYYTDENTDIPVLIAATT